RNFPQENSGDGVRGETQFRGHTRNIVCWYVGAKNRREGKKAETMLILEGLQLIVVHGTIGGAEIHGAFRDLLDAAAGSNGLIVDLYVPIFLMIFVEPLGIHRVGERRTRPVNRQWVICQHSSCSCEQQRGY